MRKKDEIAQKLKELWKSNYPDESYIISSDLIGSYSSLFTIQEAALNTKFCIKSIIKIDSDIPYYCSFSRIPLKVINSIKFDDDQTLSLPETKNMPIPWNSMDTAVHGKIDAYEPPAGPGRMVWSINERTGMFKITMTDNSVFYYARWEVSYGKMLTTESIVLINLKSVSKILKLKNKVYNFLAKPKAGQYDISVTNGMIKYDPIKFPGNITPIIHPHVETIYNDIDIHFRRLQERKYHDRAVLLYSNPGTGKTEFIKNVAEKYQTTHCIVYCRSIDAMFMHQKLAAKYNVPTIVIFEEFEEGVAAYNTGSDYARVNSSVKNILSGAYESINKKGCYKIYTTNYPDRIDPSILHRKQRIDRMILFGNLSEQYAIDCAKMYLGDTLFDIVEKEETEHFTVLSVFNDLPGVEIKSICEETIAYCEANEEVVSLKLLDSFRKNQYSDLKAVYEFADLRDDGYHKISTKEISTGIGFKKTK